MSLTPEIRRILVPPSALPSKQHPSAAAQLAAVTRLGHSAPLTDSLAAVKTSAAAGSTLATPGSHKQDGGHSGGHTTGVRHTHVALHPTQPFVAYVLEPSSNETSSASAPSANVGPGNGNHGLNHTVNHSNPHYAHRVVAVQHTATRDMVGSWHWCDIAAHVYGETDTKKLAAAAKSLGPIVRLSFYDAATLHWNGVAAPSPTYISSSTTGTAAGGGGGEHTDTSTKPTYSSWQSLLVQTTKRVLLLNLHQTPTSVQVIHTVPAAAVTQNHSTLVLAHVCEKTVGSVPSSNVLPLSDRWLLCGCVDGSMKCYDWRTHTTVKKIKGLGKGDCVVQILPANAYATTTSRSVSLSRGREHPAGGGAPTSPTSASSSKSPQRILTVTKRGTVYLIEVEFGEETVEIMPPTARFQIDQPSPTTGHDASLASSFLMEHVTVSYDPHQDRLLWLGQVSAREPILNVWNLKQLTPSSSSTSKSLLKPEPTLIINFPAAATSGGGDNPHTSPHKDDNTSYASGTETTVSSGMGTPGGGGGAGGTAQIHVSSAGGSSSEASAVTVLAGLVHPAFGPDTVVSVTVTDRGDLCWHGAVAVANNTTSTVHATPVTGVFLKHEICQAALDEDADDAVLGAAELKVHSVTARPLGAGTELVVATNWGLVWVDLPVYSSASTRSRSVATATHYLHFGAGLGSLGKSVIYNDHSNIRYGSLDVLTVNPAGLLEPKNPVTVYESPKANHMPMEFARRPFRLAPRMLQSPSGTYICLFWPCEFRYEILHTASLLQQVANLRAGNNHQAAQRRNPVVATGTGVCDFGWLSDSDVFAVLHAADLQDQAALQVPKQGEESESYNLMSPNLKRIGAGAMGVANLATTVTKSATNATLQTAKLATSAAVNTTMTVTKGATNAANTTTKVFRSGAKGVTKGVKKSFGIFGGKRKKNDNEGSIMTADDDDDESASAMSTLSMPSTKELEASLSRAGAGAHAQTRQRHVELWGLEAIEAQPAQLSGLAAATCSSLGSLKLRGGNRNPPSVVFGGPVLCVASRSEEDKEGHAHFYTKKSDESGNSASAYFSSGPTLPYPDLVTWDVDGRLCAIVVENRVAVYLSNAPEFVLLGVVRVGSPHVPSAPVTSVNFVHGALYCCTWNTVHCVLLGDLTGGICHLDSYLLASTDIPVMPDKASCESGTSPFFPVPLSLPLVHPMVLGYQGGSLFVSTLKGMQAIPLDSPMMRIGLFLAAGQEERAAKWFDAVQDSDHESLAAFLERRGYPNLALQLEGLSLETIVDFSMRYGHVDRLEDVVETFGVSGLRSIDMGRGVSKSIFGPELNAHSVVVCVGAYLLANGRVELTRRLATECLRSGAHGKKDAFMLATLLLPIDETDATRIIQRAVMQDSDGGTDDWAMGDFVRNHYLPSLTNNGV